MNSKFAPVEIRLVNLMTSRAWNDVNRAPRNSKEYLSALTFYVVQSYLADLGIKTNEHPKLGENDRIDLKDSNISVGCLWVSDTDGIKCNMSDQNDYAGYIVVSYSRNNYTSKVSGFSRFPTLDLNLLHSPDFLFEESKLLVAV